MSEGARQRLVSEERAAELRALLIAKFKALDEQRETYGEEELMRRLNLTDVEPSDD